MEDIFRPRSLKRAFASCFEAESTRPIYKIALDFQWKDIVSESVVWYIIDKAHDSEETRHKSAQIK